MYAIFGQLYLYTADYDYHPLSQTITFEPSDMTRSHQCLQIEIIDDSLAEGIEVFSVLLSTNSSTVSLVQNKLNIYIYSDDGKSIRNGLSCIVL